MINPAPVQGKMRLLERNPGPGTTGLIWSTSTFSSDPSPAPPRHNHFHWSCDSQRVRRLTIFADMAQSWPLCFGPGTRLEQSSYSGVNKVDKGHPAQHRCHCAASLHGQMSTASLQPGRALWVWQMGLCLQPCHQGVGVKVSPGSQGSALDSVLPAFSKWAATSGRGGRHSKHLGKDATAPCQSSGGKAGLGATSFPLPPPPCLPAHTGGLPHLSPVPVQLLA